MGHLPLHPRAPSPAVPACRGWSAATRPRSWPLALGPVLVGAALAWRRAGALDPVLLVLAALVAWLMQVITNLQNDVGYTVRAGRHDGVRVGQPRATARGWLSTRSVRRAIVALSVLATAIGLLLTAWRGWPVLAIGVCSLGAAVAYMGGPRPIAYTPFGELTVLAFFGLVAVAGTDWLLAGPRRAAWPVTLLAGLAVGAWAAAALCVNNHRDIEHDRLTGRRTFAVVFGPAASVALYAGLTLGPAVLAAAMALCTRSAWLLLPWLVLPAARRAGRPLRQGGAGAVLNDVLRRTFGLSLVHAALLALGVLLSRWASWPA